MGNYEFKKIVVKDDPIMWGYTGIYRLDDEYLLCNGGVLIDNEGNVIWNTKLDHIFENAVYIKEKQILVTNRTLFFGMGGSQPYGIACIDMKTGKYKWKHFYDRHETRVKLRERKPDINMVRSIDSIDITLNSVYSGGFKIDLDDGAYEYIDKIKGKREKNDNIIYSSAAVSLKKMLHLNTKDKPIIHVDTIKIGETIFKKEGYFFNKCNFYLDSQKHIYFFGVPAKRNPKNAILFKYSKTMEKIIEEIQMPFRTAPEEVYDFFNKGILIYTHEKINNKYGYCLWLLKMNIQ